MQYFPMHNGKLKNLNFFKISSSYSETDENLEPWSICSRHMGIFFYLKHVKVILGSFGALNFLKIGP